VHEKWPLFCEKQKKRGKGGTTALVSYSGLTTTQQII
jgi:hypothetical protein